MTRGKVKVMYLLNCIIILIVGCSFSNEESPSSRFNQSCRYANNEICDEPTRCALGTDDADCRRACETITESWAPFIQMACSYRNDGVVISNQPSRHQAVGSWEDRTLGALNDSGESIPRYYRVYRPTHLKTDQTVPLVLMLPGNRVSHYSLSEYTALEQSAEANDFLLVHVEQPWRNRTFSWSWYTDWDWSNRAEENPDLIFLRQLIDTLIQDENVSPDQVYLAGHSRGAAMSFIAAMEMPELITGAVIQSGFVEFGYFDRFLEKIPMEQKSKLFFMHGVLDDDVCIDCVPNGQCGINPSRRCGSVASSDELVRRLIDMGYTGSNLQYARLENVAHRWQPWLNHVWWQFLSEKEDKETDQAVQSKKTVFSVLRDQELEIHAPEIEDGKMISIPEGSIIMGTSINEMVNRYGDGWYVNEQPEHMVTLNAFQADKTEVSVAEFAQFIQYACGGECLDDRMPIAIVEGKVKVIEGQSTQPITFVSRTDAAKYCTWRGKRLPSEAEYERLALSSHDTDWPWKTDGGPRCDFVNFSFEGGRCSQQPYPVGSQDSNQSAEGIFDLGSNVAEWVSDDFAVYPNSQTVMPSDHRFGTVRGGSYLLPRTFIKSKARLPVTVDTRSPDIGFRCVLDSSTVSPMSIQRGPFPEIDTHTLSNDVNKITEPHEVLMSELDRPRALIHLADRIWVSTEQGVLCSDNGAPHVNVSQQKVDQWVTDGFSVWGIDIDKEELCEYTCTAQESCLDLPNVIHITTSSGTIFWTDGRTVYVIEEGQVQAVLSNRIGIQQILVDEDRLWFTEHTGNGTRLSRTSLMNPDQIEVIIDTDQVPVPLSLNHLHMNQTGELWFILGLGDQWPHSGLLCVYDQVEIECKTHTPPKSRSIFTHDNEVLWMHQFGVSSMVEGQPYTHYLSNIRPEGISFSRDMTLISDFFRGQIIKISR